MIAGCRIHWPVRCERGLLGLRERPPLLPARGATMGQGASWAKRQRAWTTHGLKTAGLSLLATPGHLLPDFTSRTHLHPRSPCCRAFLPAPGPGPQAHTGRATQGDWATPKLRWDASHSPGWRPPQSLHLSGPHPISCREPGLDQQGSQKLQLVPWRMEAFPSLGAQEVAQGSQPASAAGEAPRLHHSFFIPKLPYNLLQFSSFFMQMICE